MSERRNRTELLDMRLSRLLPLALVAAGLCSVLGFGLAAANAARSGFQQPRPPSPVASATSGASVGREPPGAAVADVSATDSVAGAQATPHLAQAAPEALPATPAAEAASVAAEPAAAMSSATAKAEALIGLMNRARVSEGLRVLASDPALAEVALARARNLLANGYFDHYAPDGESAFTELADRGLRYRLAGENLARNNYPEARTVQGAFDGLMASAGHRANILEARFAHVGVAAVAWGKLWLYVTVFTD